MTQPLISDLIKLKWLQKNCPDKTYRLIGINLSPEALCAMEMMDICEAQLKLIDYLYEKVRHCESQSLD